jgi:cytochrome P450
LSAIEDFSYDPFSPEMMRDPAPAYRVLRDRFPVYYSERYDTFYLSRFADVWDFLSRADGTFSTCDSTTLVDPQLMRHHNEGTPPAPPLDPFNHLVHDVSPGGADGGDGNQTLYEEVRQAHGRPMRPKHVSTLESFIRGIARERLDALLARGEFDLTQEYGGIVSASTMCHILHVPLERAPDVLAAINGATRTDSPEPGLDLTGVFETCADFIEPVVTRRRQTGWDGSWPAIDGMIDYRMHGRELTDREVAINLFCLLVGGTETLPKIVAHGLLELWRHPDQLAAVREDLPRNCGIAINEMFRFCGPAQWFSRTALVDTEVAGQAVKAGQRVTYLLQSATRDEREYPDPDAFIWDRPIARQLAFGLGQHYCIGVHLAKLEGRILLEEFLSRVSDYECFPERSLRRPSSFQIGFNTLPVAIKEHS